MPACLMMALPVKNGVACVYSDRQCCDCNVFLRYRVPLSIQNKWFSKPNVPCCSTSTTSHHRSPRVTVTSYIKQTLNVCKTESDRDRSISICEPNTKTQTDSSYGTDLCVASTNLRSSLWEGKKTKMILVTGRASTMTQNQGNKISPSKGHKDGYGPLQT